MAGNGPPRTPTAILKMRGSSLANRNTNEPQPPAGEPTCPSWLKGEAERKWLEITPRLLAMKVLTIADADSLARYCQCHADWLEAIKYLSANGSIMDVTTKAGETLQKPHPYVKISQTLADQMLRLEKEFGLTPASRSRLTVEKVDSELDRKRAYYGVKK